MSKQTTAISPLSKNTYSLAHPQQMTKLAVLLKAHIKANQLSTPISGKDYVHVEGWQFAGGMLGLFAKIVSTKKIDIVGEIKYEAEAQLVNLKDGSAMGSGFAICSNKENKKKSFDEYAVLSMAQTRAIGKAYRNSIGWVMKMTGYESTPAEEMPPSPEKVSAMFEDAKSKILACKSINTLITYDEKIQGSKKYTKEQKAELKSLINSQVDALQAE